MSKFYEALGLADAAYARGDCKQGLEYYRFGELFMEQYPHLESLDPMRAHVFHRMGECGLRAGAGGAAAGAARPGHAEYLERGLAKARELMREVRAEEAAGGPVDRAAPEYAMVFGAGRSAAERVALLREQAGDLGGAEGVWRLQLELFSDTKAQRAAALKNVGVVHMRQGRMEDAVRALRKAVKQDRKVSKGFANLGLAQNHLGKLADAEESFEDALELEPESPTVWTNYATVLAQAGGGRFQEAKEAFEKALALDPAFAPALQKLALLVESEVELAEAGALPAQKDPHFRSRMAHVGPMKKNQIA